MEMNNLKNYVDTSLNVLRTYINSLNIYVDASGDAVIGTNYFWRYMDINLGKYENNGYYS